MPVIPPMSPVLSRIEAISSRFEAAATARAVDVAPAFSTALSTATLDASLPSEGQSTLDAAGAEGLSRSEDAQMALHRAGLCTCDRPTVGGDAAPATESAAAASGSLSGRPGWSGAAPYEAAFAAAGAKHGVDPALLASVARAESNFNPTARSSAGAVGLMQFMPATARSLGIDPLDPNQAIDGAARYLRQQMDRFGSVDLAVAAYNAGPGAVSRFNGIPPYSETRSYVTKVLGWYRADS